MVTKYPYDFNLGCPMQIMAYLIMIGTGGSLFIEPNLYSIFTTIYIFVSIIKFNVNEVPIIVYV